MEEDEDTYCRYGTALEPLDEDAMPSKKPVAIEDQIVTDANGKRRFHGAFTGGFSAGFWNTVGSLEGWKPQTFKSSRAEKAEKTAQRPIDFMDDEDLGEFGFAPQRVQTTDDFKSHSNATSTSTDQVRKRKLQQSAGPIPGVPVLHQLLQPARDNIAIRLLKKMGWKEGQGIGARQTRKEKKLAAQRNARERYIMKKYGCDMGPIQRDDEKTADQDGSEGSEDESDISDDEITFAPDDFEPFVCNIKTNTFGLGYQGLSRDPVLKKQQHINLFGDAFEVLGKDSKKLSIRGQAFGVGALEEEDEDIYEKDDMTRYDFTLGESAKSKAKDKSKEKTERGVLEGFVAAQSCLMYRKKIFTITLPNGFKPRNWAVRKSRFEPLDEERAATLRKQEEYRLRGLGRHDLDPDQRGQILGEASGSSSSAAVPNEVLNEPENEKPKKKTYLERINEKYKSVEKSTVGNAKFLEKLASSFDNFTKGEVLNADEPTTQLEDATRKDNEKVLAGAKNITKALGESSGIFKPFAGDISKQERYEKFIEQNLKTNDEITKYLLTIQPLSMSDFDREMEKKEFIQARNLYRPLKGIMSDRFVSETTVIAERETVKIAPETAKKIEMVRTKSMWKPSSQLCKRFNIAEPFGGTLVEEKKEPKKSRFSVFDYLEVSVNTKQNFVTPVIIPSKIEKAKPIVQQDEPITEISSEPAKVGTNDDNSSNIRLSTKDLFASEMKRSKIEWNQVTEAKSKSIEPTKKRTSDKAKTALEKKVEEMKNKHPSEKKDLFKAIFDTDSEEEDDNKNSDTQNTDENKPFDAAGIVGFEAHKDIFASMRQSAAEINILRNTSPPRGIFANLFTKKPAESNNSTEQPSKTTPLPPENIKDSQVKNSEPEKSISTPAKITFKSRKDRERSPDPDNVYGPQIPTNLLVVSAETIAVAEPDKSNLPQKQSKSDEADPIDEKLFKLLKKSKKDAKILEMWIEKGVGEKKKKKKDKDRDKKKKSKKHKKEKKKHKDKK